MQRIWRMFGQRPSLHHWEGQEIWSGVDAGPRPADHRDRHEAEVAVEPPGPPTPAGPYRRLANAILAFDIFPPRLVTPYCPHQAVEIGDTLGVCYHFLPGLDLFFVARVVARFDGLAGGVWKAGFTYRTLVGHPMIGEETFSAEKSPATGRISAALRSWSRPGILSAQLAYPVVRRLQLRAGRAALRHLAELARTETTTL